MKTMNIVGVKVTLTDYEMQVQGKKQKILRDEYGTIGKYEMPIVKKQDIDLGMIDLMSFTKIKSSDETNHYKTIHFFTHDWNFDNLYDTPEKIINDLKQYYAVLTPDFSMYVDMPIALQINSVFKNRWCGACLQNNGIKVIPTVNWANENSFDFCFDGIEKNSIIAVSTYCRENDKELFLSGYNKMLEIINPSAIICYGDPFKEMKGNIKAISPFDHKELVEKIGREKYVEKYLNGDLYPSK
jgi:hypothetical protein